MSSPEPTLNDAVSFYSFHTQCLWDPANDPSPAECIEEAKLLRSLSLSYSVSFEEILSMVRVATLGPRANEPGFIDPRLELARLRLQLEQDDAYLRKHDDLSLDSAVAIWRTAHRYGQLLAEWAPSPELRAKYAAWVEDSERAMAVASRGKVAL
jgi:hypothetical protein